MLIDAPQGQHAYEAGFHSGGGMAIAVLALAGTMPAHGDFTRAQYVKTAELFRA